jgi:hypothetical protein
MSEDNTQEKLVSLGNTLTALCDQYRVAAQHFDNDPSAQ